MTGSSYPRPEWAPEGESPPERAKPRRWTWEGVRDELKSQPGRWMRRAYGNDHSARSMASILRTNFDLEARVDGNVVWFRWPPDPLPPIDWSTTA